MSPNYGGMASTVVAVVAAAAVVGTLVLWAFWPNSKGYIRSVMTRTDASQSQKLAFGIWITAFGTAFAGACLVYRELIRPAPDVFNVAGWMFIGTGYFFHFSAWLGSVSRRPIALSSALAVALVLIGAGTYYAANVVHWDAVARSIGL